MISFENRLRDKVKTQLSALFLLFILIASPWAVSASETGRQQQPTAPVPPSCDKLYVGAEAGMLHCNNETQEGYTLFSATSHEIIYLIDHRGELRHQWTTSHPNGSGYGIDLGPNGTLLQVVNDLPVDEGPLLMEAGGASTHIEILDANSNVLWEITEYANNYRLHHDATFLPNGNVLAIAWEYFDETTGKSMGRKDSLITSDGLWPDVVIEYAKNETGGAEIVWMWRASDHLVQNEDFMLPTYGSPADHPEKININAVGPNIRADDADWMHCNSIDYDPIHKHILLSCRHTEELYIINHNLSWDDSNGSAGDLLYRWGNPLNYDMGSAADQYTVTQHDAQFIPPGRPFAGSISYFSNDVSGSSSVGIFTPLRQGDSFLLNKSTGMYDPAQPDVEFTLPAGWGPRFQSGATLLPNGQFMVSHSLRGKIGQIGNDSQIDWEYNLPLNPGGEIASRNQRNFPPIFFKAEWFSLNDTRLQTLPLARFGVIESYDDICPDNGDDVLWDWNGDGCIEDDDQDGVSNNHDWCPGTEPQLPVDEQGCEEDELILGCTDSTALNYDPQADVDDGTCEYPPPDVVGCMDEAALNYDENANVNDENLCEYPPPPAHGCTDFTALNYDPQADVDDGTCEYPPPTEGCHDAEATNYDPSTDVHNASTCTYPEVVEEPVQGCTDPEALNYDTDSEVDDGSCTYPQPEVDENETEPEESEPVEITCEVREDCPEPNVEVEEQIEASDDDRTIYFALGLIGTLLALILTIQLSQRMYQRDD